MHHIMSLNNNLESEEQAYTANIEIRGAIQLRNEQ